MPTPRPGPSSGCTPWLRAGALLVPLIAASAMAGAAAQDGGAPPGSAAARRDTAGGELAERLVSIADSSLSYALLLPPGYTGETPHPLLLVLDPRGRAVPALEIFRRPAARHGWIVMSSYDTRSDTADASVNGRAVRAMLQDAARHLAVDARRVYLAGFSGTARLGWLFAAALPDRVAGLVGVGAGFPSALRARLLADAASLPEGFAFWGGAGLLDFNHEEVRRLDEALDGLGVPHRVEPYPGGHGWLPPEQAARAVDWLELQAMRRGLTPRDDRLVDSLYRDAVEDARAAEAAGRPAHALDRWRRVAEDFGGLRPVEEARRRAAALADRPEVRRRTEWTERLARRHDAFTARLEKALGRMAEESPPPDPAALASELELAALRRKAAGDADSAQALFAGRLLERVYVRASFYLPRRALRQGDPDRALAALELAERARPGRPRVRWQRARALAQLGRTDEAFVALAELPTGFPASLVAEDPWLAPLREDPRWEAALARFR